MTAHVDPCSLVASRLLSICTFRDKRATTLNLEWRGMFEDCVLDASKQIYAATPSIDELHGEIGTAIRSTAQLTTRQTQVSHE